eukprot:TRINITY_DN800_c0_g1_i1.p1 TRINITY_DN800_c0_g1~~TRINITY_DN800_c0_g1_i1.p1  ORF type:complete len:1112 (-),score=355.72 TRINITY_DN800_c0_g1_i1:79-3414(-)
MRGSSSLGPSKRTPPRALRMRMEPSLRMGRKRNRSLRSRMSKLREGRKREGRSWLRKRLRRCRKGEKMSLLMRKLLEVKRKLLKVKRKLLRGDEEAAGGEEEAAEGEEEAAGGDEEAAGGEEEAAEGEEEAAGGDEEAAEGEEEQAAEEEAVEEEAAEGEEEQGAEEEAGGEEVAEGEEEVAEGEEAGEGEEVAEEAEGEGEEGAEEGEEQVEVAENEGEGEAGDGEEQAEEGEGEQAEGETEQEQPEAEAETEPVEEETVNEEPTTLSEPQQDTTEQTQETQTKPLAKSNDSTSKPDELKKSTDKGSESPTKPRITYDQDDTWKPDNPTGKKMYTKNFLLQFQPYFKAKPDMQTVKDIQPSSEEDVDRGQKGRGGQYPRGGRSDRFGGNRMLNRSSERNLKSNRTPAVVLQTSENAWQRPKTADENQRFTRKVQSILNKLTPEKFDYFFEKIQKEVKVDLPSDLERFNELIFEKAVSEQRYCSTYAKLCKKFSEKAPEFRKTLLNYCQKQFTTKQPVPEDPGEAATPEARMEYEEKLTKIRSASLGLIKFIGELYKLKMLHEKIIIFCLTSLLEKSIEDYCTLMNSVGKMLEEKSPAEVSSSLEKAEAKIKTTDMGSKIKFALMDTLELRRRKWVPRREVTGPKTIQEVHADIQKQKEDQEKKQFELEKKQSVRTIPQARNDRSNFTSSKGGNAPTKTQTPPKRQVEDDGEWQTTNKRGKKPMAQQQQTPQKSQKEGIIKNSFDVFKNEETTSNRNNNKKQQPPQKAAPAPAPPPSLSPEEFDSKAEALLTQFFETKAPEEILEFMDKNINYMDSLAYKLILFALERGEKARKPAKDLLLSLRKKATKQDWNGVFNKVFDFLPELAIDSPLCPTLFGDFVGMAIVERMIDEGYLTSKRIVEAQRQTSSQILGGSLKVLLLKGVDQTTEFCKKQNILFSNYLKPGQTEEKFLSLYGLTQLHNGYYCKSEISDLIEEGETDTALISWIEKNCINHLEKDPSFIQYIMGGILKQFRDLNTISNKAPSPDDYEKEKAYFEQYSQVLQRFTKSKTDLLNEAHSFAKEQGVWPGVLGRICDHLLNTEVVGDEEIKQWRKSVEPLDEALAAVDAIFV